MIPKIIWTIWLGPAMPEHVAACVKTHTIEGYQHNLITSMTPGEYPQYVKDCIAAEKWAKATDYLRMWYLEKYGGIYLDADVTVLKNFDDVLDNEMFVCEEQNGFVSNAIVGSVAGHPILKDYLGKVDRNFMGGGDMVFQPGMFLWTEIVKYSQGVRIYPWTWFLPYDHHSGKTTYTPDTHTHHAFNKSWLFPRVSFIIPTLNRPEGLQRCIDSIKALDYPQGNIEIIIDDKEAGTVPEKVKGLYEASTGEYVVYASDDTEFTPTSLSEAIKLASRGYDLVAFNTGEIYPDEGNICEHFMIHRRLVPLIGGEIFSTKLYHAGCDNLLWAQAKKLGQATNCREAVVIHHHFTKGATFDATYAKAWDNERVEHDRRVLAEELAKLYAQPTSTDTPSDVRTDTGV